MATDPLSHGWPEGGSKRVFFPVSLDFFPDFFFRGSTCPDEGLSAQTKETWRARSRAKEAAACSAECANTLAKTPVAHLHPTHVTEAFASALASAHLPARQLR